MNKYVDKLDRQKDRQIDEFGQWQTDRQRRRRKQEAKDKEGKAREGSETNEQKRKWEDTNNGRKTEIY